MPGLEFLRLNETAEGRLPVGPLAFVVRSLANCPRVGMLDAHPGEILVLMLPARTRTTDVRDLEVLLGY